MSSVLFIRYVLVKKYFIPLIYQPTSNHLSPNQTVSRAWILAALMTTMMLAAMDATIVSTAIPQIVADLGGFSLFTWVFSIYMLSQTVMIPIYGKLADQYGRKPILITGTIIFLLGSAACAAAWNMHALIAFRVLQGIGAGAVMATVNTLAGDLFEVKERAKIQGWLSSVWGLSAIAGPSLGGFFAEYLSWRWIFLVNVPVGMVSLLMISRFLHEQVEKQQHTIDYLGAFFISLSIISFVFALLQGGQAWAWLSWQSIALFLAFLVFSAATIMVEKRAVEPIMPAWLWRNPIFVGSNLAMIMMGIMMMGPIAYLPTFAQSVYGLGVIAAGFVLAVMSVGWPIASSFSGRLYLSVGFRSTAWIGIALLVSAILLFLSLPQSASAFYLVLVQFFIGAGFGLISTPLLVGCQSVVGWERRGVVTGGNMFSRYLGQTLGAAIFGAIFNGVLSRQLQQAPETLVAVLPDDINQVVGLLARTDVSVEVLAYLQTAIFGATHAIYWGLLMFALLAFAFISLTPRYFPLVER